MAINLLDKQEIFEEIIKELAAAVEKWPGWPSDPIHALAVVQKEVGQCQKEILHCCYGSPESDVGTVRREAIQMAAMAIRFLRSLPAYQFDAGHLHPHPNSRQREPQPITPEQIQILHHTEERGAHGFYCGIDPGMEDLVSRGLMKFAGYKYGVPDPFFELTPAGRAELEKASR